MRHQIGFSDLRGRRVGIFGVGVEGRAVLARLEALDCDVVLVDDDPSHVSVEGVLATGSGGIEALRRCEVVVKAPGISRYREDVGALEAGGVAVVGGLGLWLEESDRSRVVCVTGTKGKSTVTTVLAHLANGLGVDAVAVGNLGTPPFAPGLDLAGRLVVVETSSFQATDVAHSPGLVAVTSLGEDHVDWHGSVERYHADKLSLTSQEGATRTVAVASESLRANAEQLGGEVVWVEDGDPGLARALRLEGAHGERNAAVAASLLAALRVERASDRDALLAAATGYEPLPGRFREVARFGGWRFVDDSLATNPLPTIAAIEAVGLAPLAILLGGYDRGVDYQALADAIARRAAPTTVVTLPENGPAIGALVAERARIPILHAADVDEAVGLAADALRGGGVILLSPAAPSFSQFHNWAERSAAFGHAVERVRPQEAQRS